MDVPACQSCLRPGIDVTCNRWVDDRCIPGPGSNSCIKFIDAVLDNCTLLEHDGVITVILFENTLQHRIQQLHSVMQPVHDGLIDDLAMLIEHVLQSRQVGLDGKEAIHQFLPLPEDLQQIVNTP